MGILYEGNEASFSSVIYEDEVVGFREFLQEKAPEEVKLNLSECDDIHFAVMQLILAYQKNYALSYEFGETKKLFQKVIEGFDISENHCS